jgi:hypothetical protein
MESQNLEAIWMEFMAEFKKTHPAVTGIPLEILGLQLEKAPIKAHLAGVTDGVEKFSEALSKFGEKS